MLVKKIKNNTAGTKTWLGQEVQPATYYQIQADEENAWMNSSVLDADITSGDAVVNNGSDLSASVGLAWLKAINSDCLKFVEIDDTAKADGKFLKYNSTSSKIEYSNDNDTVYTHPNHTGEVTGSGALTVDKTAITNKTNVVAAATDEILLSDASDTGNLKKVTAQSIADLADVGAADLAVVQARRNTTYGLTATWTALTFDSTDIENDALVVKHDDTNTERINVLEDGVYRIDYYALPEVNDSPAHLLRARIYKNGVTVLGGSEIDLNVDLPNAVGVGQSLSRSITVSLTTNDYVDVRFKDDTGTGVTINTMATLSVTKLEGVQGAIGATGADGDITWEGNWVSQNYTANQAVKYTNGNSYVCKLNTISNEIPTNATYWDVLAEKGDTGLGAQKRIDISVHPHNSDSKPTASATYTSEARFLWGGSTLLGTPVKIYSNSWQIAGSGNVRIYDLTNSLVIAESASITSTSSGNIVDLGTISNISAGQAVWKIEHKGDGANANEISSVSVEF